MTDRPPPAASRPAKAQRSRLEQLIDRARLAMLQERLWPAIWLPIGVVCVFLTTAWLGLWLDLPPLWRAIATGAFALALLAACVPLVRLRTPGRREALARLDRDSGSLHHPISALEDTLALGGGDAGARALWAAHRRQAEQRLAGLKVGAPEPQLARRDPYALRGLAIVALVASAFVAGPDWRDRLTSAFDWRGLPKAVADVRIDGWIDPPLYTRLPPLMLDLSGSETARARVPMNSTLVLRAAGKSPLQVSAGAGLKETAAASGQPAQPAAELSEHRYTITGNAEVLARAGGAARRLIVEAIPDAPPEIAFVGQPQSNARGSMSISYTAKDDYGLISAEAVVQRADGGSGRALVAPPKFTLALPADAKTGAETKSTVDVAESPWAGARVKLTLLARDEAGQEGSSETLTITLPQRPFTKPLARALVEQRRDLVITPDQRPRVQTALDALMIAPELFTPEPGTFLGLKFASDQLRQATSDAELIEVADFLWEMAVQIEDGDLSDAEKALRAAQEAMRQALERGAPDDEIKRLAEELRKALDRFVSEFAQRQNNRNQAQGPRDPNTRTITPDDLNNMLKRIEELSRQGATAEAQRMLEELRNILENLRSAQGQQQSPMARELNRSFDELDQLMRDQQGLRDETYRDGQQRAPQSGRGQQQRRGEQGQRGQRGQQGQQGRGQQPGAGQQQGQQQGQNGQPGGEGQGNLAGRQERLRQRLSELQQRLKGLGMQDENGLGDAEGEMRDAEGSLGRGDPGEAVDSQGRALEAMRRGMQGLAQQMQQGQNSEQAEGQDGEPGRPGGQQAQGAEETDPLGRPLRGRDFGDGRVKIPNAADAAVARARRILDELRRRLGDPGRPQLELDYLERLLRPR